MTGKTIRKSGYCILKCHNHNGCNILHIIHVNSYRYTLLESEQYQQIALVIIIIY
jgi:hypothetical protein